MKVKELTKEITALAEGAGFEVVSEYTTDDKARLDLAIIKNEEKILAVEFEKTYKWIQQRILYNSVKAHRAGFRKVIFVYPFNQKTIQGSWVLRFIRENLGMEIEIVEPGECLETVREYIIRTP